ncbi:hypothetical protein LCGC14_2009930 [marine sediment metagenome]|uniref:Uncharacterized protein n=1 Tax=marine sediment metagenome TaxID=412755 RepID=A0A0F9F0L5_9ZZZZ
MKGTIERLEEAKKEANTGSFWPGYFYAPYVPKLIISVAVADESGNAVTRYNLVDKDAMDIKFVINNLNAVRGNTSGKGKNDLVTIRCPRSGQIHELEFLAYSGGRDGGCYFMTTECLHKSPAKEYLRIEETSGSRALFNSRKEVIDILSSGKFWIDAKTNG